MQLSPVCKSTIWGGNRMRDCFGFQTKLDNIAEAWMMSARDDNPGFIISGEYMAQRIDKLLEDYPELLAKGITVGAHIASILNNLEISEPEEEVIADEGDSF